MANQPDKNNREIDTGRRPAHWRSWITNRRGGLALGSVVLLAVLAWWLGSTAPQAATSDAQNASPRVGFAAPDFTLDRLGGGQVTLSEFRGKVVIVNLWASWCLPCRGEMPLFQDFYEANSARGLVIIAVNTTYQDSEADASEFVREFGLSFPIALDRTGEVSGLYQLRALPTTFFIDRQGVIRELVLGGPMREATMLLTVETLLTEETT